MGSFTDKSFKPTKKIILEVFNTSEECLLAEIILHNFYQVDINPHFANRSKQTSSKFSMCGESHYRYGKQISAEIRQKISKSLTGKKTGRKCPTKAIEKAALRRGIPLSESHRQKISVSKKGIPIKPFTDEHREAIAKAQKGLSKGKRWWNDGVKEKFCREQPEGFMPGRLRSRRRS